MRQQLIVLYFMFASAFCSGQDIHQLREIYRSILSSDDAHLPKPGSSATQEMEDSIKSLSPQEIETMLPLIRRCLHSGRVPVIREGFTFLIDVGLRVDAAQSLEPYTDDLVALFKFPDVSVRNGAVLLVGWPPIHQNGWRI